MTMRGGSGGVDRKQRRTLLEKHREACSRCPPHDGENRGRRPRDDRHKGR